MKRRFLVLVLAVTLICSAAGVGTMAWFTSQTTSENNTFSAGTLILGSEDQDGNNQNETFANVSFGNLEPGDPPVQTQKTLLKNVGTLPFYLYRITASSLIDQTPPGSENDNGKDDTILDEAVKVSIVIEDYEAGGAAEQVYYGKLSELVAENGGFFDPIYSIQPGEKKWMNIFVEMPPETGNEYQGLAMSCDLTVYATQNDTPISGQPGNNPKSLGDTTIFKATGKNDGEWITFTWDWKSPYWGTYSSKDELRLRFKHEAGIPDAQVYQAIYLFGKSEQLEGFDSDEIIFDTDWNSSSDTIKVKRSAFPAEWDTFEVEVYGALNQENQKLEETIPYQQWDLN